jgi:hypothetical protein
MKKLPYSRPRIGKTNAGIAIHPSSPTGELTAKEYQRKYAVFSLEERVTKLRYFNGKRNNVEGCAELLCLTVLIKRDSLYRID